jgi:hypothetical protein
VAKYVEAAQSMDSPGSQFLVARASSLSSRPALVSFNLCGCLLLLILSGCGHRAVISGAINTTDFVIPAGDVVTAVADTTINARAKSKSMEPSIWRRARTWSSSHPP